MLLRRVVRGVVALVVLLLLVLAAVRLVVGRLLVLPAVGVQVVVAALVGVRLVRLLVVAARRVLLGGALVLVTGVGAVLGVRVARGVPVAVGLLLRDRGGGLLRRRRCGEVLGPGGLLGLGLGAQPAGAAALAGHGLGGDRRLLGEVVVDVAAAAGQGHHHEDDGEETLDPQPEGVGEGVVEGDVQLAAGGGQFEALGPAVDGGAGERAAVQGGRPALVGAVGEAQDPAVGAGGDRGVDVDGARGHRLGGARAGLRDDRRARDLLVDPPQSAAVLLAEPGQAGCGVQYACDLAGRALVDEDVPHGEAAELVRLVGAGAGDEVGDDLVQLAVLTVGRGEFGVAEAGAGAAHQHVADVGGGVAVEDEGAGLVAGAALLGDERGHLDGVAALQRSVGAADHPAGGDEQRARCGGEGDQGGDRLAPAEALLGHACACPVGAEHGGGQQGEAVDEGGGPPRSTRWTGPRRRGRPGPPPRPSRCRTAARCAAGRPARPAPLR